jgi:immune inhibitor A
VDRSSPGPQPGSTAGIGTRGPSARGERGGGLGFDGFRTTTGTEARGFLNAYFVDNRQYVRQDKTLRSLYNFGFLKRRLDFVEYFRYQPGALVTYWDTSYDDNNVGDHPGHGEILPVDAHPTFDHMPDGDLVRPRIMSFDSTFSRRRVKGFTLHDQSRPFRVHGSRAVPMFNDLRDYWYPFDEHGAEHGRYDPGFYSVDVPKTGTTIRCSGSTGAAT